MTDGPAPLPFAMPDVGEDEIDAVVAAIRSGWLSSGPRVSEFESAFSAFLGEGLHAVALNSATAGLHLALEACGVGPGDEVLVPTWTFTATAEVVRYLGAEPVLVDVDPVSLNIDFDDAARRITERTRAVMPVHLAGLPIPHKLLSDFASSHRLDIVEDAAHAFPAAVDDLRVGAGETRATVFSFYATKTITTGEGGMVVTRDADLAARVRVMRLHGISRNAFDRYRSTTPSWAYDVVAPGYKYNLGDPAAAMGLVQLSRAEEMRSRREQIALRYDEAFADVPLDRPFIPGSDVQHAWHLYIVRTGRDHNRDTVIGDLAAQGIGTSVHFIPLHIHPYWRDRGRFDQSEFPVASAQYRRVISLPIYSAMSDADVDRVIGAVRGALRA